MIALYVAVAWVLLFCVKMPPLNVVDRARRVLHSLHRAGRLNITDGEW